MNLMVPETGWS